MAPESFLVTALPYSADPADNHHVSLFVTHRLTPSAAEGTLDEFPNVVEWTARLAEATFHLTGSDGGDIPVSPITTALDPALWSRVFPPELVVRPWQTPELAAVPWRSFPAHRMDDYGRGVHTMAALLSPVETPSILDRFLPGLLKSARGEDWLRNLAGLFTGETRKDQKEAFAATLLRWADHATDDPDRTRAKSALRALELLDERWTESLDSATQGGTVRPVAEGSAFEQLVLDVHLARRFYERPEEQRLYAERPLDPPAEHKRPDPPDPDFHQRCSFLGATPAVLRRLGLVVDLRVDDLSLLSPLSWMRGDISIEGLANGVPLQPAVTCLVNGTDLSTVSGTGDFDSGALRLGDDDRYGVLDLDPDATGLKLERFLRSLPRLVYSALNGDPAHAAPATLRASGFSIARRDRAPELRDRLSAAGARDADLLAGAAAPLDTEAVTRGLRLEVWDDASMAWHSLHRRVIDVEVDGDLVIDDAADVGFLQGAALTRVDASVSADPLRPYHAHEVMAGWEGWSLSAPPPGKVVVDDTDVPVDHPDEGRITPVVVRSKAGPGSLPRLRYGRSYAFRAWCVDLAGNSPPASVAAGSEPLDPQALGEVAVELGVIRKVLEPDQPADALSVEAHQELIATRQQAESARAASPRPRIEDVAPSSLDSINRLVRGRLVQRVTAPIKLQESPAERIDRVVGQATRAAPRLTVPTSSTVASAALVQAVATAARRRPDMLEEELRGAILSRADLVTKPHPFLRWDAVLPPTWVPLHPYTDGESLLTLVVRSGVELGADGTASVTPPAGLAAAMQVAHPELGWRADCERHVAPPKTSQLECEHHGCFDAAFGPSATAAARAQALAQSLRESGTFLDRTRAHPTVPGQRLEQKKVALHHTPTADPDTLVTLDDIDAERGRPLGSGQYVVHGVDTLALPYLPEPLAQGVSLVFPDAGRDHRLDGAFAVEGVTLPFGGEWPEVQPHRLVLDGGSALSARVEAHVVTVTVPPGERLRMRVSSSLPKKALELLGVWRGLDSSFTDNEELVEAALDGWFWWLTPYEEVQLVHAVPRPVERPRVPAWFIARSTGNTAVVILGLVDVHGPSTERLDVEAAWTEPIDDPARDGPELESPRLGVAGHTPIGYQEDLVLFGEPWADGKVTPLSDGGQITSHTMIHHFEDTKHRRVNYTVRATTRYREYFPPALYPGIDDLSLVSEVVPASIPSSARPPKPVVRDVLPLFRWAENTEPDQPFGLRRTRRSGLRIYLARPWFATGEGEMLGVVLGRGDGAERESVSQWGADPVWRSDEGLSSATHLPLVDPLDIFAYDNRDEPGRPVAAPAELPLVDVPGQPTVTILGYQPEYSPERKLWFADIALDPGTAFWPFLRLAVVRYQPESLSGVHLSPVVVCDFTQLTPERTATVTRPDLDHARVIVTGAIGEREQRLWPGEGPGPLDRVVVARVERREPTVDSDLGWETVAFEDLPIRGREGQVVSWGGVVDLPEAVALRRPGSAPDWRIAIEEWEIFPADGQTLRAEKRAGRMVYADHLPL